MNRAYRVIWSKARNCYVVVSEIAKRHSKAPSKVLAAAVLSAVLATGVAAPAMAAGANVVYDDDTYATITLEGEGVGLGTKITNLADGDLSAASTDAVTGAQLYATQQQMATFQADLARNNSTIAVAQTDINTLKGSYLTLNSDVNTLKTQVETGFNVLVDGAKIKQVNPASNYFNIVTGDNMEIVNNNNAVKISAKGDGVVASGNTGLVTGGTVFTETRPAADGNYITAAGTAGANLTALDTAIKANEDALDGKANVALDNITDAGKTVIQDATNIVSGDTIIGVTSDTANGVKTYTVTANINANGQIASGDTGLVSGGTVFDEVRVAADGEYIQAANTAAQNFEALDAAVKDNADDIAQINTDLSGKANVALDNITDAGKTVVRDLAKESVKVVNGTNTTVTEGEDGVAKTYAVNVTVDGVIEQGNTGIVDGGTVFDALKDQKDEIDDALDLKANKDASNVADKTAEWGAAIGTGAVASGNGELVTGGTVYDALQAEARPAADGNYITVANTAGANLTVLDAQIKTNADAIEQVNTDLTGKANVSLDNITDAGKTVIQDATNIVSGDTIIDVTSATENGVKTYTVKANISADGQIASGDTGLVSGDTVFNEVRVGADGEYVKAANTTAQNLEALDTAVKDNADDIAQINTDLSGKANVDASNLTGHESEWGTAIGTGAVESANGQLVTGGTVYDALQAEARPAQDGNYITTANTAGANLTALDTAIKDNADDIEQINTDLSGKANVALDNITDAGKTVVRDLAKEAVKVVNGTNTTVTEAEDGVAKTYAVNVTVDGVIEDGNTGIVDGGTVFDALKDQKDEIDDALDLKANKDASNVADKTAEWGAAIGTGAVEAQNGELVTGGTVYDALQAEARPAADGNYITVANTAGANLTVLDAQVKTNADAIEQVNTDLTGKANVSLDNITDAGKTVIQDATNVVSGDGVINVTSATENGVKTYTITAGITGDGAIAEGNTGLVSGGTVYTEVRPDDGNYVKKDQTTAENLSALDTAVKANEDAIDDVNDALDTKANKDASNVADQAEAWGTAIGTGAVAQGDVKMVSGDTVYNALRAETRPAADGTYIAVDNTAGDNLTALDTAVAGLAGTLQNAVLYDSEAKDTVTLAGTRGTKITNAKAAALSRTSSDVVIGAQLWATNQNIDGMKTDININKTNISALNTSVSNALESVTSVSTLVDTVNGIKADVSLNNLTDAGQLVIANAAANAVQEYMRDNNKIVPMNKAVSFNKVVNGSDVVAYDDDSLETVTLEGPIGVGTKLTNVADGDISAASMDAVTGAQLYAVQQQFDTFQSALARNNATIAAAQTDINTLKTSYLTMSSDVNTLKTQMETGFNVTIDGAKVKQVNPANNQVDFKNGDNIKIEADGSSVKVSVPTDGEIASGNTGIVSGGAIYDALQDKANADASNIGVNATQDNSEAWGDAIGGGAVEAGEGRLVTGDTVFNALSEMKAEGQVAEGDEKAISGDTAFTELRPADGEYVKQDNTTAENLSALDGAVKDNADAIEQLGTDLEDKANVDASNLTGHEAEWGTAIGTGAVEAQNGELVTGGTVYDALMTESRPASDGEFISADATAGENLTALDNAVKDVKDGMDGKADTDLSNITADGETVIRDIAKEAVKVIDGDTTTVTEGTDGDAVTYKVEVNAGEIEEANEGFVTGGQVYDYVQDITSGAVTHADLEAYAKKDASNLTGEEENWGAAIGTGEVAEGDGKLVTGDTVFKALAGVKAEGEVAEGEERAISGDTAFSELRPADGEFVKQDQTTAENLTALDGAVKDNADAIEQLGTDLEGKANVDASNVSDYAAEWGTAIGTGAVEAQNGELVTGGTVYDALMTESRPAADGEFISAGATAGENLTALDTALTETKADVEQLTTDLDGKANVDASNLAGQEEAWGTAIGTGEVEEGDGKLVTGDTVAKALKNVKPEGEIAEGEERAVSGDTVYSEVRPADGEYVKKDQTTAENLTALDSAVKDNADAVAEVAEGLDNKANKDASNVADYAAEWGTAIGTGVVEEGNSELVTGGTVFAETRPADGNYVSRDMTAGENLNALDEQVKNNADAIAEVAEGMDNKANKDASNVAEHTAEWGAAIGTGVVEEGNGELVTGGTVYTAIQDVKTEIEEGLDGKADTDLGNITDDGKQVVKDLAKEAVTVSAGDHVSVEATESEGNIDYKVSVVADGAVESGNEGIVTGGQVADAISEATDGKADTDLGNITDGGKEVIREVMKGDLDKKANKDASNIETEKWAEKLGVGEVKEGETNLVNGDTVFKAIDGLHLDIIEADNENGAIAIGAKEKYDDLGAVDISNSKGEARVLRGVVTDPDDPTSAASVEYVDGAVKGLAKDVSDGFAKLDGRIDKVGSQAAALAGLHPFEIDGDQKWNLAAGIGNYKGETSGAIGLFYRPSSRVMLNVASTISDGDNMVSGGISVALDKGSTGMTKAQMANDIKNLKADNEQLKKMISMLMQKSTVMDELKRGFPDVPRNHWANNAVATLHGNGVLAGYPDGEFKGDKPMTRYEYAEMLYKAMKRGVEIPKEVIAEYQTELNQVGR